MCSLMVDPQACGCAHNPPRCVSTLTPSSEKEKPAKGLPSTLISILFVLLLHNPTPPPNFVSVAAGFWLLPTANTLKSWWEENSRFLAEGKHFSEARFSQTLWSRCETKHEKTHLYVPRTYQDRSYVDSAGELRATHTCTRKKVVRVLHITCSRHEVACQFIACLSLAKYIICSLQRKMSVQKFVQLT